MKEKRKIALRIPASSYIMHCILFILLKVWMKEKTFLFFSSSVSGHSTRFNLSSDFEGKKGSKDRILQHGAFWKLRRKKLKLLYHINSKSCNTKTKNNLFYLPCLSTRRFVFKMSFLLYFCTYLFWCNISQQPFWKKKSLFFLLLSHFVFHLNENRLSNCTVCTFFV